METIRAAQVITPEGRQKGRALYLTHGWVNGSQGGDSSGKGGAAIGGDRTLGQGGRTGGMISTFKNSWGGKGV